MFLCYLGDMQSAGYPLAPCPLVYDEKNKPEQREDLPQILLSPSIKYIGHDLHTPRLEYVCIL